MGMPCPEHRGIGAFSTTGKGVGVGVAVSVGVREGLGVRMVGVGVGDAEGEAVGAGVLLVMGDTVVKNGSGTDVAVLPQAERSAASKITPERIVVVLVILNFPILPCSDKQ
jgi:hypothetical protein